MASWTRHTFTPATRSRLSCATLGHTRHEASVLHDASILHDAVDAIVTDAGLVLPGVSVVHLQRYARVVPVVPLSSLVTALLCDKNVAYLTQFNP